MSPAAKVTATAAAAQILGRVLELVLIAHLRWIWVDMGAHFFEFGVADNL